MVAFSHEPETLLAYWERKHEELALLRGALGEPTGGAVSSVAQLVEEKLRLRARMVARFIERHPFLTESNLSGVRTLPLDGALLDYGYQRYDLKVKKKPFASWIYPGIDSPNLCSLGLWAASGMSALFALLLALDRRAAAGHPLYLAPDTYFETVQIVENQLRFLRAEMRLPEKLARHGILLLDSISRRDPWPQVGARSLASLAAVIVDTTCYDVAAPEIAQAVERCRSEDVPCILVRSHMKIDSLGLEYGRLGSIVVVLPRPSDGRRTAFVRLIAGRAQDLLVKTGAVFMPHAYFPLASDAIFRRLSQRRNAIMRRNNLRAAASLGETVHEHSATRIRDYHHGLFFFLQPLVDDWSSPFAHRLRGLLVAAGLDTRVAPSFAYDFIAITRLRGQQYASAGGLRLSLPDYPEEQIDRLVEVLTPWAVDLDRA